MIVKHFLLDVNEVNAYIVACEETRQAMLIDAGAFDDHVVACLRNFGLSLSRIFITHDHFDHTEGLRDYVDRFGPEVISGASTIGGCKAAVVTHGDEVAVGHLRGTVLATPGHTPWGLSLAFPGCVFTGDALFAGSVGGTTNAADAKRQMEAIRAHIFTLPPDTLVYAGHGPASTVDIERRYNPFFN